jgi:hypothetical protein
MRQHTSQLQIKEKEQLIISTKSFSSVEGDAPSS